MMKPFYPSGNALFEDDSSPVLRTRRLTEWFDVYDDDDVIYKMTLTVIHSEPS